MARRQFSGRGRVPAPKRQIANDGLNTCSNLTATFGAATLLKGLLSGFLVAEEAALTLVRTRGMITMGILTSGAANNVITGAYGQIVVSTDAIGVGITAVPGPLTDIENDWYVWVPFALRADTIAEAPVNITSNMAINYDSRGQRKLKNGEALISVIEMCQSDGTTGMVVQFVDSFRNQSKL